MGFQWDGRHGGAAAHRVRSGAGRYRNADVDAGAHRPLMMAGSLGTAGIGLLMLLAGIVLDVTGVGSGLLMVSIYPLGVGLLMAVLWPLRMLPTVRPLRQFLQHCVDAGEVSATDPTSV